MSTQPLPASKRAVEQAYGRYLQHLWGCHRCRREAPCQKGARRRHIWRAARRDSATTPVAGPAAGRRAAALI